METLSLAVDGMGCGGCVKKVREALSDVPGVVVKDVSVGKAVVTFDPAISSEATVIAALGKKNYPASKAGSASGTVTPAGQGGHCGI